MFELYEQMLPARLYTSHKIRTTSESEVLCRLCGKFLESVPHVLTGCPALAQHKYLLRHNAALKILFFEMLRDLKLADEVPLWYSPAKPKTVLENKYSGTFPCICRLQGSESQ